MKILHLSSAKSWRGGEQQIAYLVEALQEKDIPQIIYCPSHSALEKYCFKVGIKCIPYKKGFSLNPLVSLKLKNICVKEKVSIIHLHDAHAHNYGVLSASIFNNKTPMVLSRRVIFPLKTKFFSSWKYNHPSIQKIICVSEAIQKVIAPRIEQKAKLTTIYSSINIERFTTTSSSILRSTYQITPSTSIIAYIAAISKEKDHFTFINTAKILIEEYDLNAKFLIIGKDGGEKKHLEQYIQSLNLQEQIIFTGFRKDLEDILIEIDLLLFTSTSEGLGTTILDAFACRIPVVATNVGGIPELVKHQKTGWLAPIGNAKKLASGVNHILKNPDIQSQFINNAQRFVQNFSTTNMTEQTLKLYKEVIES